MFYISVSHTLQGRKGILQRQEIDLVVSQRTKSSALSLLSLASLPVLLAIWVFHPLLQPFLILVAIAAIASCVTVGRYASLQDKRIETLVRKCPEIEVSLALFEDTKSERMYDLYARVADTEGSILWLSFYLAPHRSKKILHSRLKQELTGFIRRSDNPDAEVLMRIDEIELFGIPCKEPSRLALEAIDFIVRRNNR